MLFHTHGSPLNFSFQRDHFIHNMDVCTEISDEIFKNSSLSSPVSVRVMKREISWIKCLTCKPPVVQEPSSEKLREDENLT